MEWIIFYRIYYPLRLNIDLEMYVLHFFFLINSLLMKLTLPIGCVMFPV